MTIEHHQDDARAIIATPTEDALPRRFADFATLGEALDYAASGSRGLNFHDARGTLTRPYPFRELREDALACARRLIASGVKPEERIALVAETGPEFAALFFGVVYAGAGRFRCRCRPRSAGAIPISNSFASSSLAAIPRC